MLNLHTLSSRSIPITNHSFDTINPRGSSTTRENHFLGWRSRRRSSTIETRATNPQQLGTSRRLTSKHNLSQKSARFGDDGVQFDDEVFHPSKNTGKRLLGWRAYDPHIPSNRQLVMAHPLYLELPCVENNEKTSGQTPYQPTQTTWFKVQPQMQHLERPKLDLMVIKKDRIERRMNQKRQYLRLYVKRPSEVKAKPKTAVTATRQPFLEGSLKPWEQNDRWQDSSDALRKTPSPMPMANYP